MHKSLTVSYGDDPSTRSRACQGHILRNEMRMKEDRSLFPVLTHCVVWEHLAALRTHDCLLVEEGEAAYREHEAGRASERKSEYLLMVW